MWDKQKLASIFFLFDDTQVNADEITRNPKKNKSLTYLMQALKSIAAWIVVVRSHECYNRAPCTIGQD